MGQPRERKKPLALVYYGLHCCSEPYALGEAKDSWETFPPWIQKHLLLPHFLALSQVVWCTTLRLTRRFSELLENSRIFSEQLSEFGRSSSECRIQFSDLEDPKLLHTESTSSFHDNFSFFPSGFSFLEAFDEGTA